MAALTIQGLVTEYMTVGENGGNVVEESTVTQQLIDAVRFYLAYGDLKQRLAGDLLVEAGDVDESTELTSSEWGLIKPLFNLYAEKQNAMRLEASRANGLDVYGRSVSEAQADINTMHEELPHKIFSQDIISVESDGYGDSEAVQFYGGGVQLIITI